MNTSQKLLFNPMHWIAMSFSLRGSLATMSSPIANFHPLLQRSPKNPKKKKEHVESDSKFMVEREKTKDTFYTCYMLSGYCSCPVGSTCAFQNCSFLCSSSQ